MSLDTTIREVQKKLGVPVDGRPGPETWDATHMTVIGKKPAADAGLDTIIRAVQKKLGIFVDGSPGPETWGAIHLAVVGKKPPSKIKNAKTPTLAKEGKKADSRSEANIATLLPRVRPFARALIAKTPVWESPAYKAVGALGTDLGLEWGGNWKKVDEPHFQLRPAWAADLSESDMLAELRKRKDSGKNFSRKATHLPSNCRAHLRNKDVWHNQPLKKSKAFLK